MCGPCDLLLSKSTAMPCKPASLTAEVSLADPSTKISFSFNALQARSTVSPLVSASPTLSFDLGCDTSMLASSGTVRERLETELMFPAITSSFKSLKKKLADRLKTFDLHSVPSWHLASRWDNCETHHAASTVTSSLPPYRMTNRDCCDCSECIHEILFCNGHCWPTHCIQKPC